MALDVSRMVTQGHLIHDDVKQFADLLTGVMTDQPVTITNRLALSGNLTFSADNTYDIGAAAASRPRYVYAATALVSAFVQNLSGDLSLWPSGNVNIGPAFSFQWVFVAGGNFHPAADNASDIGQVANRPRTVYAATSFIGPGAVPPGGASGQVLSKSGAGDYALAWITPSAGGGLTLPLTQSLTWSPDNTYDIGASGASRPRDLFLGRNMTVSGTSQLVGNVGIGTNPQGNVLMNAVGNLTGNATQIGMQFRPLFDSTATAQGIGYSAQLSTASGSYAFSTLTGVYIDGPIINNTSVSTVQGFKINNQGTPKVTSAYGLVVDGQSNATSTNIAILVNNNPGGMVAFGDANHALISGTQNFTVFQEYGSDWRWNSNLYSSPTPQMRLLNGTLTLSTGSLVLAASSARIQGDFSNATHASRTLFQTTGVNSSTVLGVIPSGTGTVAQINLYNGSDPNNASLGQILVQATDVTLRAGQVGTGTYLPMLFNVNNAERLRIDTAGNLRAVGHVYSLYLHTSDGSNGIVQADAGSLYVRGASGQVIMDGASGLSITGPLAVTGATTMSSLNVTTGITTSAIISADWFRISSGSNGIYSAPQGQGINFIPQPALYPSGDIICGLTSTQTLSGKTYRGALDYTNLVHSGFWADGAASFDLGNATTYANQMRAYKAWGTTVTVYCSGSNGIIMGQSIYGSGAVVIASGDAYTFIASQGYWWVI